MKLPQDDRPSCLTLFPSNGALICGTHRGSIYAIKTPLSNTPTGNLFHNYGHSAKISQVKSFDQTEEQLLFLIFFSQIIVAFHEGLVISCCEDGVLMLWGTQIKHGVKNEDWTPVVLQNKGRFLSLVRCDLCPTKDFCIFLQSETIRKLQDEVEEIKRNREYRLHQLETNYLADIQRRTTMSENERKHHENQIQRLNVEKEKEQRTFESRSNELKEKFAVEKQRIGKSSGVSFVSHSRSSSISDEEDRSRMARELQKEEELIRLSQKMMEDNEFRLKSTIEASENEIRDIAEFFTGKIRETENELAAVRRHCFVRRSNEETSSFLVEKERSTNVGSE